MWGFVLQIHPNKSLSTEISKDTTLVWIGSAISHIASLIVRRQYGTFNGSGNVFS